MSRTVAHNAVWNVTGTLASLALGLVALPVLLHALGAARLGIFTLALGLIGFSGLLDLGLGRALTQTVSSALGRGRPRAAIAALVWHVMSLLAGFGMLWILLLWWIVPPVVQHLFKLHDALAAETIVGLRAVALSMPLALLATGAMGALEGLQEFRRVSTQRAALSLVQFGLPALVALWRPDVGWVIAALAFSRALGAAVWLGGLRRVLPKRKGDRHQREDLQHLLRFGGWLSVSNLIGPLMDYADRFYLASVFPPAGVAHYTVPYDSATKLTALPRTALNAVFPALAQAQTRPGEADLLLRTAAMATMALVLPPLLVAAIFAKPLLDLWLGSAFAGTSIRIFELLLQGIFINAYAYLPFVLLQAHARSDVTAKLHVLEFPLFIVLLVWAVHTYGLLGAALAWTLRVAVDAALLYWVASRLLIKQRGSLRGAAALFVTGSIGLAAATYSEHAIFKIVTALVMLIGCAGIAARLLWQWLRRNAADSTAKP